MGELMVEEHLSTASDDNESSLIHASNDEDSDENVFAASNDNTWLLVYLHCLDLICL